MRAALLALALSGCTVQYFPEPVTLSTKPLPESPGTYVSARRCARVTLLLVPLSFAWADTAYREALAKAPGTDALINTTMKRDILLIVPPWLYAHECLTVEGTAVKLDSLTAVNAR